MSTNVAEDFSAAIWRHQEAKWREAKRLVDKHTITLVHRVTGERRKFAAGLIDKEPLRKALQGDPEWDIEAPPGVAVNILVPRPTAPTPAQKAEVILLAERQHTKLAEAVAELNAAKAEQAPDLVTYGDEAENEAEPARKAPVYKPVPATADWRRTTLKLSEASGEKGPLWDLTHGVPGVLGELVDLILDTARRPNRVLALGAAITVVGTLIGRRVLGPTRSATHLYVASLAPTGAGKQHQIDIAKHAMVAAGAASQIGPNEFISMPAFINMMLRRPLALCFQDEFGAFLKRVNNKRASGFETAITKSLREMWGLSAARYDGPEWAGRPSQVVYWPAISLCAFSTQAEFYAALADGDLPNGFLNRILVLSTSYRAAEVTPRLNPVVPDNIASELQTLFRWRDSDDGLSAVQLINPAYNPKPDVRPWADLNAETAYQKFQRFNERQIESNPGYEHFIGRAGEMAVRIATIRAVARDAGDYDVAVSAEDFEWAAELVRVAGEILIKEVSFEMEPDLTRGQLVKKVLAIINKHGGSASQRDLLRAMPNSKTTREIDDVLKTLESRGSISKVTVPAGPKGGRPSIRYQVNEE